MTLGCYWIYTKCAAIAEVYTGRHNNCSLHLQPSGHSWAAHIMACISLQFTLSKWCINYKLVGSHCSDRCTYGDAFQLAPLSDFLILQLHLYIPNYRFCSRFNLSPLPRGVHNARHLQVGSSGSGEDAPHYQYYTRFGYHYRTKHCLAGMVQCTSASVALHSSKWCTATSAQNI